VRRGAPWWLSLVQLFLAQLFHAQLFHAHLFHAQAWRRTLLEVVEDFADQPTKSSANGSQPPTWNSTRPRC